jgi:hypothetical protein
MVRGELRGIVLSFVVVEACGIAEVEDLANGLKGGGMGLPHFLDFLEFGGGEGREVLEDDGVGGIGIFTEGNLDGLALEPTWVLCDLLKDRVMIGSSRGDIEDMAFGHAGILEEHTDHGGFWIKEEFFEGMDVGFASEAFSFAEGEGSEVVMTA